ncbi:MAG: ABC transporter substrate-binding protein, partial [Actinomycetota bacterium]|nr:ABC transporter substrate-binding protein [Actinomycetota bacterium]
MNSGNRLKMLWLVLLAAAGMMLAASSLSPAQAADETSDDVLRIGWAQDPQSLNPFIGLDEESYTIWAINWDLLVNFDPKDLSPSPGIAESWEISDDRKTVTFKIADRKWSDGKPITSKDVKWTLETLGT